MEQLTQIGIIPIDHSALESLFVEYTSPRHKITDLEKSEKLIRLKRGLYVVSPTVSGKLLSTELIANHIYGPSYISMQSALRYYGLIPESVYTIRSMTTKRSRQFENKIARFDYTYTPPNYFHIGITQIEADGYNFLIATPEKALCDLIAYTPKLRLRFAKAMLEFLEDDLRFDMDALYNMDIGILRQCAEVSKKKNDINNLIKLIQQ